MSNLPLNLQVGSTVHLSRSAIGGPSKLPNCAYVVRSIGEPLSSGNRTVHIEAVPPGRTIHVWVSEDDLRTRPDVPSDYPEVLCMVQDALDMSHGDTKAIMDRGALVEALAFLTGIEHDRLLAEQDVVDWKAQADQNQTDIDTLRKELAATQEALATAREDEERVAREMVARAQQIKRQAKRIEDLQAAGEGLLKFRHEDVSERDRKIASLEGQLSTSRALCDTLGQQLEAEMKKTASLREQRDLANSYAETREEQASATIGDLKIDVEVLKAKLKKAVEKREEYRIRLRLTTPRDSRKQFGPLPNMTVFTTRNGTRWVKHCPNANGDNAVSVGPEDRVTKTRFSYGAKVTVVS